MTAPNLCDVDDGLLRSQGKIIHQVWFKLSNKSDELFKKFSAYRDSWIEYNPDWTYIIWTENISRNFMYTFYPQFLDMYDSYPYDIQRVDAIRYFALHRYGGLYADMDSVCFKSLNDMRANFDQEVYFVESANKGVGIQISNSIIYSIPGHPFWPYLFKGLLKYHKQPPYYPKHMTVMCSTGPIFVDRMFCKYKLRFNLDMLPAPLFNPKGVDSELTGSVQELINNGCYMAHFGAGSWESGDSKILIFLYNNYKMILFIVLCFLPALIVAYMAGKQKQDKKR